MSEIALVGHRRSGHALRSGYCDFQMLTESVERSFELIQLRPVPQVHQSIDLLSVRP
jgi:hypothetical protein